MIIKGQIMSKRESNYDYLRIISAVAVVFIHVSSTFVAASFDYNYEECGFLFTGNLMVSYIFDTLSRFAVPCFIMLSGAFILADERNADFRYFYGKSFRNVGVHAIVFSLIYTIYSFAKDVIRVYAMDENPIVLLDSIKRLLMGKPLFHMWYLYMLLILYLLTPLIFMVFSGVKNKKLLWGGIVFFLCLSSLSYWTGTYTMGWDVGTAFCYLSYYLFGYSIRMRLSNKKNFARGIGLIFAGILVLAFLAFMRYIMAAHGVVIQRAGDVVVNNGGFEIFAYEGLDPFVTVASVLIFIGVSYLPINSSDMLAKLSSLTFFVYLIHGGVWSIIRSLLEIMGTPVFKSDVTIPIWVMIVLFLSSFLAIVYRKIWKLAERRYNLAQRIDSLFSA